MNPNLPPRWQASLDAGQITAPEAIVARYPRPAESAEEERDQHVASLAFHRKLAEFSGNPLLGFVVDFMASILADLTVYRRLYDPPNRTLYERGRASQLALIAALREDRAEEARAIMRAHMEGAEALMQRQEAQVMRRFIAE